MLRVFLNGESHFTSFHHPTPWIFDFSRWILHTKNRNESPPIQEALSRLDSLLICVWLQGNHHFYFFSNTNTKSYTSGRLYVFGFIETSFQWPAGNDLESQVWTLPTILIQLVLNLIWTLDLKHSPNEERATCLSCSSISKGSSSRNKLLTLRGWKEVGTEKYAEKFSLTQVKVLHWKAFWRTWKDVKHLLNHVKNQGLGCNTWYCAVVLPNVLSGCHRSCKDLQTNSKHIHFCRIPQDRKSRLLMSVQLSPWEFNCIRAQ